MPKNLWKGLCRTRRSSISVNGVRLRGPGAGTPRDAQADSALAVVGSNFSPNETLKIGYLDVVIRDGITCHVIRMVPLDYCSYCGHRHPYKFRQHVRACENMPLCPESEWQNERDFLNGAGPYSE